MNVSLDKIVINEEVIIKEIKDTSIKRRFLDIGLSKNMIIKPVFNSICGNIRAYKIQNSLFGIRDNDAKNIMVMRKDE